MRAVDDEIAQLAGAMHSSLVKGAFSRRRRSEAVGQMLVAMLLPSLSGAMDAEDRDRTNLVLTQIAAGLAVFRAQRGGYPETLAELTPAILAAIPADPYSRGPLVYKRRDVGYVLYSV